MEQATRTLHSWIQPQRKHVNQRSVTVWYKQISTSRYTQGYWCRGVNYHRDTPPAHCSFLSSSAMLQGGLGIGSAVRPTITSRYHVKIKALVHSITPFLPTGSPNSVFLNAHTLDPRGTPLWRLQTRLGRVKTAKKWSFTTNKLLYKWKR